MASGVSALVLAAAVIGAGTIAVKKAYSLGAEPGSLLVVRFGVAGALFLFTLPFVIARAPRPLRIVPLALCAAAGVILFAGAQGEFYGLARLPAAVILLLFVAPVWIALVEWIVWRQRVTARTATAMAIILAGMTTMVGPVDVSLDFIGVLEGLAASLGFACFLIIIDRTELAVPTSVAISVAIVAGGLVGLAFDPGAVSQELRRPDVLPYALFIGFAVWAWSVLAMIGLRRTNAVTTAIVSATEPAFVALFAFLVLGERLSVNALIGGATVMVGIILMSSPGGSSGALDA